MQVKRILFPALGFILVSLSAGPLPVVAGGAITLTASQGHIYMTVMGRGKVEIRGTPYHFDIYGINRLKLIGQSRKRGIFLKRLGVKLVIRNLRGDILHIVRKEGFTFKVDNPLGETLIFIRILSQGKAVLFRQKGHILYTVTADNHAVKMKDADGNLLYTLKGTAKAFPAGFFCIRELTWEERVACFLLYEKMPFPYE